MSVIYGECFLFHSKNESGEFEKILQANNDLIQVFQLLKAQVYTLISYMFIMHVQNHTSLILMIMLWISYGSSQRYKSLKVHM